MHRGVWADWFWNEDIWLPPNVSWTDLQSSEKVQYSNFGDLFYPIPAALVIILLRSTLEK